MTTGDIEQRHKKQDIWRPREEYGRNRQLAFLEQAHTNIINTDGAVRWIFFQKCFPMMVNGNGNVNVMVVVR